MYGSKALDAYSCKKVLIASTSLAFSAVPWTSVKESKPLPATLTLSELPENECVWKVPELLNHQCFYEILSITFIVLPVNC